MNEILWVISNNVFLFSSELHGAFNFDIFRMDDRTMFSSLPIIFRRWAAVHLRARAKVEAEKTENRRNYSGQYRGTFDFCW